MKIKATIKAGSKAHAVVKKLLEDQAAFKAAVESGELAAQVKKHGARVPVSDK